MGEARHQILDCGSKLSWPVYLFKETTFTDQCRQFEYDAIRLQIEINKSMKTMSFAMVLIAALTFIATVASVACSIVSISPSGWLHLLGQFREDQTCLSKTGDYAPLFALALMAIALAALVWMTASRRKRRNLAFVDNSANAETITSGDTTTSTDSDKD